MKGEQPVEGLDGGAPAGAVDAHREQAASLAVDGGPREPARDVPPQRVLAVGLAFFGLRAIPKIGSLVRFLRPEETTHLRK